MVSHVGFAVPFSKIVEVGGKIPGFCANALGEICVKLMLLNVRRERSLSFGIVRCTLDRLALFAIVVVISNKLSVK